MRLVTTACLCLSIPLFAQGIFNNASKPGEPTCSRNTVGVDSNLEFGSGHGTMNSPVGGTGKDLGPAPTSQNTSTGGKAGGTRLSKDLYTSGHVDYPVGKRPDASAFTAYGQDGKAVSIASLKGKIVVVGLWSYRCEPSARMLMEMAQLFPREEKFGFVLIAVNFDASRYEDGSQAVGGWSAIQTFKRSNPDFFKNEGLPLFVPGTGKEGAGNFVNQVDSLPLLAVVDRDGRVASVDIGYKDKEIAMRLSQLIREEHTSTAPSK